MSLFHETKKECFLFDSHMHLITLKNICISAYMSFVEKNKLSESWVILSSDYIYKDLITNFAQTMEIISIIEQPIIDSIYLLENDLRGVYESNKNNAFIQEGGIEFAGQNFDKIVISPLLMDFNYPKNSNKNYYNIIPSHSVICQATEMLAAFHTYRTKNPHSKLLFRPYIGINPHFWKMAEIEQFLHQFFSSWSPFAKDYLVTQKKQRTSEKNSTSFNNAFAGIKLYPPLGFDPYPENSREKEKMDLLYSFCEQKTIPIITHCDDQGFRIIDFDTSQKITSPERWKTVLKKYPNLYLDFAHFGKQYTRTRSLRQQESWQEKIVELILRYPNVYTDTSFNGSDPNYWNNLAKMIDTFSFDKQDSIRSKILFGSDWPLSLSKIQSATAYWNSFKKSILDNELKYALAHTNPMNFYFRDTPS